MSAKPKPTGLAAFTKSKPAPAPEASAPVPAPAPAAGRISRKRAQGSEVALTVRLPRAGWTRLRQLADSEGVSLQTLLISGIDKVFAEHGLPPIHHDATTS